MTVTKVLMIEKLAQKTGLDRKIVSIIFLELLDLISDELNDGNRLEFREYFILGTKHQQERVGQNPKTLEKVVIPARRVVYFKKGQRLKAI